MAWKPLSTPIWTTVKTPKLTSRYPDWSTTIGSCFSSLLPRYKIWTFRYLGTRWSGHFTTTSVVTVAIESRPSLTRRLRIQRPAGVCHSLQSLCPFLFGPQNIINIYRVYRVPTIHKKIHVSEISSLSNRLQKGWGYQFAGFLSVLPLLRFWGNKNIKKKPEELRIMDSVLWLRVTILFP